MYKIKVGDKYKDKHGPVKVTEIDGNTIYFDLLPEHRFYDEERTNFIWSKKEFLENFKPLLISKRLKYIKKNYNV